MRNAIPEAESSTNDGTKGYFMGEHKETAMPRKKRQPKPIYLDVCALNRRYDDMSDMRILIDRGG